MAVHSGVKGFEVKYLHLNPDSADPKLWDLGQATSPL